MVYQLRTGLLLCLGICTTLKSQILNIDREVTDSMTKNWYGLVSGSFNKDKQKIDIQDLNIYTESVYKFNYSKGLAYIGQIDATVSGKNLLQNEGYFQCRLRDLDRRKNSFEYYLQYQWNGAWGMKSRSLGGLNFRKRILELNGYDLYLGLGTFYQREIWNYNGVSDISKIPLNPKEIKDLQLRTNVYLKGAIKLSSKCDFVCQTFFQSNAMSLINDPCYRWYWSSEIIYNMSKNWMIGFNYDHTYNQKNPVPINRFYYGYTGNVSLKF